MTASKSSHTMRNIVIGLLALWSIISLIIIVVWATSPDMKGASECNNNLKKLKEKFAEEEGVWNKDRMALEEQVRQGRTNQSLLLTRMEQLKSQLLALNQSLESCHQQNDILHMNITALEDEIELHKAIEANLTANITLQQEMIDLLEHNVSQEAIELQSCASLKEAAQNLQTAAEKQMQSCQSSKQFMQKQLEKCKTVPHTSAPNNGPDGRTAGVVLAAVLCISFLLGP
ncbi:uncharacterized protein Hap1MRO34_017848 [Clarias gariepinus]|uniref:uncharacterized protein si:ch211-1a19.3 n=1 Tax=Clarias gariepinus TaxID=13013 RepID=UPI00234C5FBB|nr:uncharacterized protein si:ch211-1a19.3 [Clarias gariepinus]